MSGEFESGTSEISFPAAAILSHHVSTIVSIILRSSIMRRRFALATLLRFVIIQKESTTVDTMDTTARTTHISASVLPLRIFFTLLFTVNLLSEAKKRDTHRRAALMLGAN
jgi:hypothetical protein